MIAASLHSLEDRLKAEGRRLGFELIGIAPATDADGFDRLGEWLERGFAGEMKYMHRLEAARHPRSILPRVKSVVMVGLNYNSAEPTRTRVEGGDQSAASPFGKVARYARGRDYHDVLREKLSQLLAWVQAEAPDAAGRGVVDTAPLLERDFGRRAGLGWFGKNTMLINKKVGSYFFLGALLLDLDLKADPPFMPNHCGNCTACLDACPTQAFAGPGELDSRRCISYLTIELRGPIPEDLRPGIGGWLFGCDVCQEVCPWNRKAPAGKESALQPRADMEAIDPAALLGMSDDEFRRRFRDTALWRGKRRGLVRNAAIVLGNVGAAAALPALAKALDDHEPQVREAARWAIEQIQLRNSSMLVSAV